MNSLDAFLSTVERSARLNEAVSVLSAPLRTATPKALVLVVIVSRCECGAVHRSPNQNTLVRYDNAGRENSVQFTRRDAARFSMLPREVREHVVSVPYCEACFRQPASATSESAQITHKAAQ